MELAYSLPVPFSRICPKAVYPWRGPRGGLAKDHKNYGFFFGTLPLPKAYASSKLLRTRFNPSLTQIMDLIIPGFVNWERVVEEHQMANGVQRKYEVWSMIIDHSYKQ